MALALQENDPFGPRLENQGFDVVHVPKENVRSQFNVALYNAGGFGNGYGAHMDYAVNLLGAFGNAAGPTTLVSPLQCSRSSLELNKPLKQFKLQSPSYAANSNDVLERGGEVCIVTGFPRSKDIPLKEEPSYAPMASFIKEARKRFPTMIYICAAAEVAANSVYNIKSEILAQKLLGAYNYQKMEKDKNDPLVRRLNDTIRMQTSRYMNISKGLKAHPDIKVLYESFDGVANGAVGLARSNNLQDIFSSVHLENAANSIPVEQIRDWQEYARGRLHDEPVNADHIIEGPSEIEFGAFKDECRAVRRRVDAGEKITPEDIPTFDIKTINSQLRNTHRGDLLTLASAVLTLSHKMRQDGRAQKLAPLYKPATESGILAPA